MDVSFGFQYSADPFLEAALPSSYTKISDAPNSLGIQLSWIPVKWFDGVIEPLVTGAFYGTWTSDSAATRTTASLVSFHLGIASEPFGELHGPGFSLTAGPYTALGVASAAKWDASFKAYVRF
jgi:hypothetical protein